MFAGLKFVKSKLGFISQLPGGAGLSTAWNGACLHGPAKSLHALQGGEDMGSVLPPGLGLPGTAQPCSHPPLASSLAGISQASHHSPCTWEPKSCSVLGPGLRATYIAGLVALCGIGLGERQDQVHKGMKEGGEGGAGDGHGDREASL